MKNSNNIQSRSKRENQLIFIEYEKPTKEGHLITVVDSYHNTIGRINRSYNEQSKKYEFTAYDHTGKPLYMRSEKVWELKREFSKNRTKLLEDAHQRRLESKENQKNISEGKTLPQASQETDKKIDSEKSPSEKSDRVQSVGQEEKNIETIDETKQSIREDELESIRERENGREDRLER